MAEFVLGKVNQGKPKSKNGMWCPGDVINAYDRSVMFFTGVCTDVNPLDLCKEVREALKDIGSFAVTITDTQVLAKTARIAGLEPTGERSLTVRNELIKYLFSGNFENQNLFPDMTMTLPATSTVEEGVSFYVGYLSVLTPLGQGLYRLEHDYPLQRDQGPRFETFERAKNENR